MVRIHYGYGRVTGRNYLGLSDGRFLVIEDGVADISQEQADELIASGHGLVIVVDETDTLVDEAPAADEPVADAAPDVADESDESDESDAPEADADPEPDPEPESEADATEPDAPTTPRSRKAAP